MPNTREKLIELLCQVQDYGTKNTHEENSITMENKDNAALADHLIANGATIPVRCKDCRSWERNIEGSPEHGTCYCFGFNRGIVKHENGYCDKGVRRN